MQSTSRKASYLNDDPIESFFSHLKSELIYLVNTTNIDELTKLIHEYIYFYNSELIQNKIGMSPIEYLTHAS
ncbi:IS3 family transposase [Clostridium tertium]|uniref:IS3 family transposase n=1 Tax=Clostridium tertium TaxID=1559 RepID=UPI0035217E19